MTHAHASSKAELTPSRLFDCSHIVALVTGGATGIGEMSASGLIQGGARVIIASRKESELKSKAPLCRGADLEHHWFLGLESPLSSIV